MKAKTVAGGSPDDAELERTTTEGADPDGTCPEQDPEDAAGADAPGEPEPGRGPARQEADAGALLPSAAGEAGGCEAKARSSAGGATDTAARTAAGAQSAPGTAAPDDTPVATPEAAGPQPGSDGRRDSGSEAGEAVAEAGPGADDTRVLTVPGNPGAGDKGAASPAPEGHASAAEAGAESAPDTAGHEPERGDRPASGGTAKDAEPQADEKTDLTLTLAKPVRAEAKATGAAPVPAPAPGSDAEEAGAEKCTEVAEAAGGTTDAEDAEGPSDAEAAEGTEAAEGAEGAEDEDGGHTRTLVFRAPGAAAVGSKPKPRVQPKADTATDEDAPPTGGAEDADAPSGGSDAPEDRKGTPARKGTGTTAPARKGTGTGTGKGTGTTAPARTGTGTGTAATDKAAPEDGGRKVPAWARQEESDAERTSRLVALKPLDEPGPAAPRPHPETPAPATPKPPLDLLAELTNTPPPPETPRRTLQRRVKVWTPILLVLAGTYAGAQMLRPLPAPHLAATETGHAVEGRFSVPWPAKGQGAVRVPGSGDIGTFGEQKPVPTASVAKVMTAYVILKGHPLRKNEPGPDITVDAKAVADGNSENESRVQGLTAGAKFSQLDMLKMLMIPSANNAARLLARWDTGSDSEAGFVEKMNAAARDLGMKDTTYTDPSGLDAGTVSTAADQLKLAEAVMKDEVFRAIVAMPSAPIKGLAQPLINNNELLTVQGLSVRGIKTGSSTPAGGALMWAAYKSVGDETPVILGTLMDQRVEGPDPNATRSLALVLANSRKIIEAVRTALASTPLIRKGDTVGYVDDGLGGRTPLVAAKDLNVIGVPGQRIKLTLGAGAPRLPHTAKAGTEVATLTAGEGEGAKSVPVAVRNALAEPSVAAKLTRLG